MDELSMRAVLAGVSGPIPTHVLDAVNRLKADLLKAAAGGAPPAPSAPAGRPDRPDKAASDPGASGQRKRRPTSTDGLWEGEPKRGKGGLGPAMSLVGDEGERMRQRADDGKEGAAANADRKVEEMLTADSTVDMAGKPPPPHDEHKEEFGPSPSNGNGGLPTAVNAAGLASGTGHSTLAGPVTAGSARSASPRVAAAPATDTPEADGDADGRSEAESLLEGPPKPPPELIHRLYPPGVGSTPASKTRPYDTPSPGKPTSPAGGKQQTAHENKPDTKPYDKPSYKWAMTEERAASDRKTSIRTYRERDEDPNERPKGAYDKYAKYGKHDKVGKNDMDDKNNKNVKIDQNEKYERYDKYDRFNRPRHGYDKPYEQGREQNERAYDKRMGEDNRYVRDSYDKHRSGGRSESSPEENASRGQSVKKTWNDGFYYDDRRRSPERERELDLEREREFLNERRTRRREVDESGPSTGNKRQRDEDARDAFRKSSYTKHDSPVHGRYKDAKTPRLEKRSPQILSDGHVKRFDAKDTPKIKSSLVVHKSSTAERWTQNDRRPPLPKLNASAPAFSPTPGEAAYREPIRRSPPFDKQRDRRLDVDIPSKPVDYPWKHEINKALPPLRHDAQRDYTGGPPLGYPSRKPGLYPLRMAGTAPQEEAFRAAVAADPDTQYDKTVGQYQFPRKLSGGNPPHPQRPYGHTERDRAVTWHSERDAVPKEYGRPTYASAPYQHPADMPLSKYTPGPIYTSPAFSPASLNFPSLPGPPSSLGITRGISELDVALASARAQAEYLERLKDLENREQALQRQQRELEEQRTRATTLAPARPFEGFAPLPEKMHERRTEGEGEPPRGQPIVRARSYQDEPIPYYNSNTYRKPMQQGRYSAPRGPVE